MGIFQGLLNDIEKEREDRLVEAAEEFAESIRGNLFEFINNAKLNEGLFEYKGYLCTIEVYNFLDRLYVNSKHQK